MVKAAVGNAAKVCCQHLEPTELESISANRFISSLAELGRVTRLRDNEKQFTEFASKIDLIRELHFTVIDLPLAEKRRLLLGLLDGDIVVTPPEGDTTIDPEHGMFALSGWANEIQLRYNNAILGDILGEKKWTNGCVRRAKAWSFRGCESRPAAFASAGSNRGRRGGNETSEAPDVEGHESDLASVQAVTRVNVAQASKGPMRKPTCHNNGEGRSQRGRERTEHPVVPPGYWRQHAYKRKTDATREAPWRGRARRPTGCR